MKTLETTEHTEEASVLGVNRRQFLFTAALAGGALVLKCATPVESAFAAAAGDPAKAIALNAWLKIGTDDSVTIVVSQAEMGQGISTTLPAVLADELGADWSRVKFENSPTDPAYRNPRLNWQFTGNSESTTAFFDLMRQMGASAREMLIGAAANKWKVDPASWLPATAKTARSFTPNRAGPRVLATSSKPPRRLLPLPSRP